MWRKLLGILTLFSFLPYFSICQNKLRENGWYHILSGQTDSISREPIVTTKDFIALKLDTDYFGKYVWSYSKDRRERTLCILLNQMNLR